VGKNGEKTADFRLHSYIMLLLLLCDWCYFQCPWVISQGHDNLTTLNNSKMVQYRAILTIW